MVWCRILVGSPKSFEFGTCSGVEVELVNDIGILYARVIFEFLSKLYCLQKPAMLADNTHPCDTDHRQVFCICSSNCIDSTQPSHSERHRQTADACSTHAICELRRSILIRSASEYADELRTFRSGIAIRCVTCFQLVAAVDHTQILVGIELVEQSHIEVTGHAEVVGDANLDQPSSDMRA